MCVRRIRERVVREEETVTSEVKSPDVCQLSFFDARARAFRRAKCTKKKKKKNAPRRSRVSSSPPPIDCRVRVRSQSRKSVKGHSRVVAAAVVRGEAGSRRTWSARASPGRRGWRPRGAWPVFVAGARETGGEGSRGQVTLESGREDGRRPRATNANLVAHSALRRRVREHLAVRDRRARGGRERARTDEACMLLGSRKRTDDPSGGG
jgi:hypothetical protein